MGKRVGTTRTPTSTPPSPPPPSSPKAIRHTPWASPTQTPSHYPINYFPPPINLPGAPSVQNAQEFSSDFIGYPILGGPGGHTPWSQPPTTPNNTPPTLPSGFYGQTPPPSVGWNIPTGSHPGSYSPGHAMHTGGVPLGWGPSMSAAHIPSRYPYGGYGAAPPAWPQTPAFAPLAKQEPWSRIDKWAVGDSYSPVLEAPLIPVVGARLLINPLLSPLADQDDSEHDVIRWNMLLPPSYIQTTSSDSKRSWLHCRNQPATFPRLSSIRIISRCFPWMIACNAKNPKTGVTCGDLVDQIHEDLYIYLRKVDIDSVSKEYWEAMKAVFRKNRAPGSGIPPGTLDKGIGGIRRIEWAGRHTMFDGLVEDSLYIRERYYSALPGVFVLQCGLPPVQMETDGRDEPPRSYVSEPVLSVEEDTEPAV